MSLFGSSSCCCNDGSSGSGTDLHIGNSNLTLTENRTLSGDNRSLTFTNLASFTLSATNGISLDSGSGDISAQDNDVVDVNSLKFTDRTNKTSPAGGDGAQWVIGEGGNQSVQTPFADALSEQGRFDISYDAPVGSTTNRFGAGGGFFRGVSVFESGNIGFNDTFYFPAGIGTVGQTFVIGDVATGRLDWGSAGFTCSDLNSCSIDNLSDVDVTTVAPVDGDFFKFVGADSEWQPATVPAYTVEYFTSSAAVPDTGTTVTLAATPSSVALVFRNGVLQIPTTDWSVAANIITFTEAFADTTGPGGPNNETIVVVYFT
jgi:hypothetical protein